VQRATTPSTSRFGSVACSERCRARLRGMTIFGG
jgi:hypothetical protein